MIYRNDQPIQAYDNTMPIEIDWAEPISTMRLRSCDPALIESIVWEIRASLRLASGGTLSWTTPKNLSELIRGMVPTADDCSGLRNWLSFVEFNYRTGIIETKQMFLETIGWEFSLDAFLEHVWSNKKDETALITLWYITPELANLDFAIGTYLSIAPGVDGHLYQKCPNYQTVAPSSPRIHFHRTGKRDFPVSNENGVVRMMHTIVNGYYVTVKHLAPKHLCEIAELSHLITDRAHFLPESVAETFCKEFLPARSAEYQAALYYNVDGPSNWHGLVNPCGAPKCADRVIFRNAKGAQDDLMIIRRYSDAKLERGYQANFVVEHYIEI